MRFFSEGNTTLPFCSGALGRNHALAMADGGWDSAAESYDPPSVRNHLRVTLLEEMR